MSISVHGIGWLTKEGYGCIRSELRHAYEVGEGAHTLPKRDIFSHPFKNFGRLDTISKMTAYAVSLALQDAGIEYSPIGKQDIGIVGTNAEGSLRSDIEYFRDYLEGGRTLSRGNLFIYTLPSSPIGEAAIHFGFLGPVRVCGRRGQRSVSRARHWRMRWSLPAKRRSCSRARRKRMRRCSSSYGGNAVRTGRSSVTWQRPELLWKQAPMYRGWYRNSYV